MIQDSNLASNVMSNVLQLLSLSPLSFLLYVSFLPSFLRSFLPSFLPNPLISLCLCFLHSFFLPCFLIYSLASFFLNFLVSWLASLLVYLFACLLACLLTYLLTYLLACLPPPIVLLANPDASRRSIAASLWPMMRTQIFLGKQKAPHYLSHHDNAVVDI